MRDEHAFKCLAQKEGKRIDPIAYCPKDQWSRGKIEIASHNVTIPPGESQSDSHEEEFRYKANRSQIFHHYGRRVMIASQLQQDNVLVVESQAVPRPELVALTTLELDRFLYTSFNTKFKIQYKALRREFAGCFERYAVLLVAPFEYHLY